MEALWQGVPVLTFTGNRWVGRISRSILTAAGLPEWIEPSREAYIERAIQLATSRSTRSALARLRKTMRARLKKSAACDSAALCRELEAHYLDITHG
jgi:predicted O-linked N-acetylglucosamine transferase (SPINDLY family)